MTDLTPEAAALFEQARKKHDPTDADCGRVLGALHARLGIPEALASASVLEAASPAVAGTKAGASALLGAKATKLILASVVLGGSVSAGLLGSSRPTPHEAPAVVTAAVATSEAPPDASLAATPARPEPSTSEPAPRHVARHARSHGRSHARTRPHAAAPPTESPRAAEAPSEVALIRRALTSLRDRDPESALTLLQTHAVHYPDGLFRKEREGARVLALCAAGRVHEGRTAKADFLSHAGSSPIAARVQLACRDD